MDNLIPYLRAQDGFDTILAAVSPEQHETRSACELWTVRDVVGHVTWAQHQLRHWAAGTEYGDRTGAPGSAHPAELTGDDPLATWRAAREACTAALTPEALTKTVSLPPVGDVPLTDIVELVITDTLAHTWDIADPLGLKLRMDPELVDIAIRWARRRVVRAPGFFGPEQTPPQDADDQTRLLAYLGRRVRQPQLSG